MNLSNSRSVETRITRLTREIAEIDDFFYGVNKNEDRSLYAGMLERKRDDMVRCAVLQMHTAIEDLLGWHIFCHILEVKPEDCDKQRTKSSRLLHEILFDTRNIGFVRKLQFAEAFGLLNAKTKEKRMTLNTLRNKCSHNWLLKATVRRGKPRKQKKPPFLSYKGRDLHTVAVLKEFLEEYGPLYGKLFVKYLG
jgi:hypothetical protein